MDTIEWSKIQNALSEEIFFVQLICDMEIFLFVL